MRKRKSFALAVQHTQHHLAFLVLLCIGALSLLPAQAQSPTTPQEMPISISKPKPPGQTGLRRPVGDGNVWTFRVVPEPELIWVEGPNWSYPGKGEGTEPCTQVQVKAEALINEAKEVILAYENQTEW